MYPGSHAFAAAIDDTPASRSSLTIRSCNVPNARQFTRVGNTQTTRLNLQQNLKPAELLLAHRHHRHGATPRTPKPEGVSPQPCTGVSSLYCAYRLCVYQIEMSPFLPFRNVTVVGGRAASGREASA